MNKLLKNSVSVLSRFTLASCLGLACLSAMAIDGTRDSQNVDAKQDLQALRESVKEFLTRESGGLPGTVTIEVGPIDSRLNLANCNVPDIYLPGGARLWGKVSVGVRCNTNAHWAIMVPSMVKVAGNYYVTSRPVMQGQTLSENDIAAVVGDLTSLSSNVVTDPSQALGHTSMMSLGAGIALRQDSLRLQQVVIQGQTVRLTSNGSGFRVSTDAQALNSASEGQLVKVKTSSGQVISGTAKAGGVVIVAD